jgi:hypothetical protein
MLQCYSVTDVTVLQMLQMLQMLQVVINGLRIKKTPHEITAKKNGNIGNIRNIRNILRNAVFLRTEEFVGDFWSKIPPDGDCAYNCQTNQKN